MRASSKCSSANRLDRVLAVGHVLDLVALVLEGQTHGGPDPLVVLDDQDAAHAPIIPRPGATNPQPTGCSQAAHATERGPGAGPSQR